MDILERLYVNPQVCVMDVQTEGFLCVSGESCTNDLKIDQSWSDIFGTSDYE